MSAWSAPGLAPALAALRARLAATPWPGPPAGFTPLAPARSMRTVLAGTLAGPAGPLAVVLKWHRPAGALDRLGRALRGGRGPREARVLRALAESGVPVPEALAATDEGVDLLVTRRVPDLALLPEVRAASPALLGEVAAMLAHAHAAGLVHRDLTRANVGLTPAGPMLVDLGGARTGGSGSRQAALSHLAQAAHGMLHGASRAQRVRALKAWLAASGTPAEEWRAWVRPVERALERRRRLHRRRRERRIARAGQHFAALSRPDLVGVRRTPEAPPEWEAHLAAWLEGPLAGAVALKAPAVLGLVLDDGRRVVLKRYAPVAGGRESRALRDFRRAVALEERGLAVAPALLAAARPGGPSVLVSAWLEAPDLDLVLRRERRFAAWPRARRVALLEALGRSLRALHDVEVAHRDLKAPNLLVSEGPRGFAFPVVDVEGARPRYRPVAWRRRAGDLARLAADLALPRSARLRVLAAYVRVRPVPPWDLRRLAVAVHRRAERHRARLARRPSSAPPEAARPRRG